MCKKTTRLFVSLSLLLATVSLHAKVVSDPEAVKFLAFEAIEDGKCHILSEGGKLMLMHNNHPDAAITFRLTRYFADVRQWGRATGTAIPGEEAVKLGCTEVDGRPQRWEIERANFAPPSN
jgi:hypothetical protein